MPCQENIRRLRFNEDGSATLMARLTARPTAPDTPGTPLTQSLFSAIAYTVTDLSSTPPAAVSGHDGATLTIASVVFDTIQGWTEDTIGHNLRTTIVPAAFPTGGHIYRVDIKYTLTSGEVGWAKWEGPADAVYAS